MSLLGRYEYRLDKKRDSVGALYRRVVETLRACGAGDVPVRFHLEQAQSVRLASGLADSAWLRDHAPGPLRQPAPARVVARALDRVPELAPFAGLLVRGDDPDPCEVISNLDARWRDAVPGVDTRDLPAATLLPIADAIPKSLPFVSARFYFQDVPWLGATPRETQRGKWELSGSSESPQPTGFELSSISAFRTRHVSLSATAVLGDPSSWPRSRKPPDPPGLLEKLETVGSIARRHVITVTADEPIAPETWAAHDEIARRLKDRAVELLQTLDLPHVLPERLVAPADATPTGPRLPALLAAFAPLGYRHAPALGDGGAHAVARRTPRHHQVSVQLEIGRMARQCTAGLVLRGPGWVAAMPLPLARTRSPWHYPITDAATWVAVVENLAVLVRHVEPWFVSAIEELHPAAPEAMEYPE